MSIWTDLQAEIRERFGLMDDWEMWEREMRWKGRVWLDCGHAEPYGPLPDRRRPILGESIFCAVCNEYREITKTQGHAL